jgi:hypothetical protein
MTNFRAYIKLNWKTSIVALVAITYSAQQFVSAVVAWENHQPANWRIGIVSLIVATGMYFAKDGDNQSTSAQVAAADAKVAGDPLAPAKVAAANKEAAR